MLKTQLSCAIYFASEKGRHQLYLKDHLGRSFLLGAEAFSAEDVRKLFSPEADFAYGIDFRDGVQELSPSDAWQFTNGLLELARRTETEITIHFDVFNDEKVG